jgi:hypothetical protein
MVPWLTGIEELILTLKPSSQRKKNQRTGFENLPSTVSSLSMLPQNLPVLLKFLKCPKWEGYFDVQNQRR